MAIEIPKLKLVITGHRANKLWGYDFQNPNYLNMQRYMMKYILQSKASDVFTPMSLGADFVAAFAVINLKNDGHDIKLHCLLPCTNHSAAWKEPSRNLYHDILKFADSKEYITNYCFDENTMQTRNDYMACIADRMLFIWDGTTGGTSYAVKTAKKNHVAHDIMRPSDFAIAVKEGRQWYP